MTDLDNRRVFIDWLKKTEVVGTWSELLSLPICRFPLLVFMANVDGLVMPVDYVDGRDCLRNILTNLFALITYY